MADHQEHNTPVTAITCFRDVPLFASGDTEGVIFLWTSRGHDTPYQRFYKISNNRVVKELYDPVMGERDNKGGGTR